jgi:hypothetical protein
MPSLIRFTVNNVDYILDNSDSPFATVGSSNLPKSQLTLTLPGSVSFGGKDRVVQTIGPNAFSNSQVRKILLPDSVRVIDTTSFNSSTVVLKNMKLGSLYSIQFVENGVKLGEGKYSFSGTFNGLMFTGNPGELAGFPEVAGTDELTVATSENGALNSVTITLNTYLPCPINAHAMPMAAKVSNSFNIFKLWFGITAAAFAVSLAYIIYAAVNTKKSGNSKFLGKR